MSEHVVIENTKSKMKAAWNKAKKPVLITAGALATIGVATAVVKARSKAANQEVSIEEPPFDIDTAGQSFNS